MEQEITSAVLVGTKRPPPSRLVSPPAQRAKHSQHDDLPACFEINLQRRHEIELRKRQEAAAAEQQSSQQSQQRLTLRHRQGETALKSIAMADFPETTEVIPEALFEDEAFWDMYFMN